MARADKFRQATADGLCQRAKGEERRAKGEGRRAKSEGGRAKGEGGRGKGEGRRGKGEGGRGKGEGVRAKGYWCSLIESENATMAHNGKCVLLNQTAPLPVVGFRWNGATCRRGSSQKTEPDKRIKAQRPKPKDPNPLLACPRHKFRQILVAAARMRVGGAAPRRSVGIAAFIAHLSGQAADAVLVE
ncbi:MAG: hypothetical protein JWM21_4748 [Acidobacteria bacterium]|nr:hypothetical protein [Acidobacteriota bacterium]